MEARGIMRPLQVAIPLLFALSAAGANAQMYKSVGPDGKVTYSDTPPAAAARVETRPTPGGSISAANLPYEVAQASRNHPVTLYTTSNCLPCDDGRKLLSQRGIPFREKTVTTNDDITQLRQTAGEGNLPVLYVGRALQRGFEAGTWNSALTLAGYPTTSRLPRGFTNPPPEAAAPRPAQVEAKQETRAQESQETPPPASSLPPATGNAPPGFRF